MAPCFRKISQPLYFLFYRSPPGLNPGAGSVYWVTPPGDGRGGVPARPTMLPMVKTIHSVHHGSVGHHTQNTRARAAASRLRRIAGTDCALGLAFLGSGTLIEGWACYVEDLLMEAPGFYDAGGNAAAEAVRAAQCGQRAGRYQAASGRLEPARRPWTSTATRPALPRRASRARWCAIRCCPARG